MNELPVKTEEIEDLRDTASRKILTAYSNTLDDIVNEQIRLAKEAKNEAVRMKAGQKIIEHVVGQPTQRVESTSRSLKIISHMQVPGFTKDVDVIDTEIVEEKLPLPKKELRAAVTENKKSRYVGKIETNPKGHAGMPLVPEIPLVETVK